MRITKLWSLKTECLENMRKWDIEHAHGMHVARKPEQLKDAFAELSEEESEQYENFIMQVVELLLEEN